MDKTFYNIMNSRAKAMEKGIKDISLSQLKELELSGKIEEAHTSYIRYYVHRKPDNCEIFPYVGRYGKGYRLLTPNYRSSNFSFCAYYIFKEV